MTFCCYLIVCVPVQQDKILCEVVKFAGGNKPTKNEDKSVKEPPQQQQQQPDPHHLYHLYHFHPCPLTFVSQVSDRRIFAAALAGIKAFEAEGVGWIQVMEKHFMMIIACYYDNCMFC